MAKSRITLATFNLIQVRGEQDGEYYVEYKNADGKWRPVPEPEYRGPFSSYEKAEEAARKYAKNKNVVTKVVWIG